MSLAVISTDPSERFIDYILGVITENLDEDEVCELTKYFSAEINNIKDVNVRVKLLEFIENHRKDDVDVSIGL
jgi:hypothetical protein